MTNPNPNPDGRWKKGQSGNPAGKPKGVVSLKTMLKNKLAEAVADDPSRTYADKLIETTMRDALAGDTQSRKLVWEYIEGKPNQTIDANVANVVRIVDDL